jgi:hypothetical protein
MERRAGRRSDPGIEPRVFAWRVRAPNSLGRTPRELGDSVWSVGADEEFSEIELEFEHAAEELGQA